MNHSPAPIAAFTWLGQCGETVLLRIPAALKHLLHGFLVFCRDLLHGCMRVIRLIGRGFRFLLHAHTETASEIQREWNRPKRNTKAWLRSVLRILGTLLLSENGILYPLMQIVIPIICIALLWSAVRLGTNRNYDIAVTFNGQPLGVVRTEQDYLAAEQIVRKRLSYAETDEPISFERSLSLEPYDGYSPMLTSAELADKMLRSADISLCDAYGVFVNDEFYGAVADPHPIQDALNRQLSEFSDRLGDKAEDIFYADTVSYEKGIYPADNLVDAKALARKFTGKIPKYRTYTAKENESIYAVAERFTTTPDAIREINPDLPDIIPKATRVRVPVETHYLPIVYTKTATVYTSVDYETYEVETAELPVGAKRILTRGEFGEKQSNVRITYTDGAESGRVTLSTRLSIPPVDEKIGIGTFAAQPYSTDTVINGDGRYGWPVDGGRITDTFGGERMHRGIDIGAAENSNIYAGGSGVVIVSGWNDSYGNYIIIDHEDGYQTLYAHCNVLLADVDQRVQRGQVIALVGSTGHSTGPHLHFEVRINGINYNPFLFLHVNAD